jgi:hypothetical protein
MAGLAHYLGDELNTALIVFNDQNFASCLGWRHTTPRVLASTTDSRKF